MSVCSDDRVSSSIVKSRPVSYRPVPTVSLLLVGPSIDSREQNILHMPDSHEPNARSAGVTWTTFSTYCDVSCAGMSLSSVLSAPLTGASAGSLPSAENFM